MSEETVTLVPPPWAKPKQKLNVKTPGNLHGTVTLPDTLVKGETVTVIAKGKVVEPPIEDRVHFGGRKAVDVPFAGVFLAVYITGLALGFAIVVSAPGGNLYDLGNEVRAINVKDATYVVSVPECTL